MVAEISQILVVDDEPDILKLMGFYLKSRASKVFLSESGAEALELLGKEKIDLIFSDISMPEMDGIEFLKRVRVDHPSIPFVFVSAYGQHRESLMNSDMNVLEFITKPLKKQVISDILDKL